MQIVPIRDLKDTVKIEKICEETMEPVFITKNGYGKLVVMDIDCFQKMFKQSYEAVSINEGLNDLEKGRIVDGKTIKKSLKNKYKF